MVGASTRSPSPIRFASAASHAPWAVGGVEEDPAVGPEHLREVVEAGFGEGHEVGVDQIDGGAVHRGEHAIGDVRGPRSHQEIAAAQEFRVTHDRWFGCGEGSVGAMPKIGMSRTVASDGLYIDASGLYSNRATRRALSPMRIGLVRHRRSGHRASGCKYVIYNWKKQFNVVD